MGSGASSGGAGSSVLYHSHHEQALDDRINHIHQVPQVPQNLRTEVGVILEPPPIRILKPLEEVDQKDEQIEHVQHVFDHQEEIQLQTMSISRMRLDDEFYIQITTEALKFLTKCNIPLFKHSYRARKEFLHFMEADRKQDIERMFLWLQEVVNGNTEARQDTSFSILVLHLFPAFISESTTYSRWLRAELGLTPITDPMDMENIFESLYEEASPVDVDKVFQLIRETTLEKLPECKSILVKGLWFETFANAIEGLPLAIFISIPDEKRGFPIVYCNREIEVLTGFSRRELHGSSTPFFFSPSEPEKAEDLRSALSCSLPLRVQLATTFADSQQTEVVLFTKPMYDAYARFRYVFTIMSQDTSAAAIKRIGCFLSSLPNVIYEGISIESRHI